jgi:hypothetical protein
MPHAPQSHALCLFRIQFWIRKDIKKEQESAVSENTTDTADTAQKISLKINGV